MSQASFSTLTALPSDPLLGIMAAYREDPREEKFDLGVGVYKDESGHTPILRAVKRAEAKLLAAQDTKVYEGPRGNIDFCNAIEDLVFGKDDPIRAMGRTLSFTTPGGCGALFLGASLMKRMGARKIWRSDPTWPNHVKVASTLGLDTGAYRYADNGAFAADAMLTDLSDARAGDGVIIQGPCHNPTGIDIDNETWVKLGEFCRARGLIPMVDIAYHGFANGLDEDMVGVRRFIKAAGDVLISYSCSKNFGLYRERTGCFLAMGVTADTVAAAGTHVADIARATYSMPPAHGAGIVATILGDPELRREWEIELEAMRQRIVGLRRALAEAIIARTGSNEVARLADQTGMFSQLPLTKAQTETLRETGGIYMPGSGRINIAGVKAEEIPALADAFATQIR